jgi:hypothetical protein
MSGKSPDLAALREEIGYTNELARRLAALAARVTLDPNEYRARSIRRELGKAQDALQLAGALLGIERLIDLFTPPTEAIDGAS